jgi:dienelactone hydrolase
VGSQRNSFGPGRRAGLAAVGLLIILGCVAWRVLVPGAPFLLAMMDKSPEADQAGQPFNVRETAIELGDRQIPLMVYEPRGGHSRALLVIHGVHWGGFHEPRLVLFARRLAAFGFAVVTPQIADMQGYDLVPRAVDDIERSALWLLDDSGLVDAETDGRIGVLGISFGGGLALSATTRPSLRDRVAFGFSFGGHADMDRTMQYLVNGDLPAGGHLEPHVYGQAVILRLGADRLVPPEDVDKLDRALLAFLGGDRRRAEQIGIKLGRDAHDLLSLCLERKTSELGQVLEPVLRAHQNDPRLSPVRFEPPDFPVFLLHGDVDNVIPPSETAELDRWASRAADTRTVVSSLITHVELDAEQQGASVADYLALVRLWTEMLRI